MANRHTNKKLRAEVRARMAATGESHQTALTRILTGQAALEGGTSTPEDVPDLIPVTYFGIKLTVAVFDVLSHLRVVVVSGVGGLVGLPFGDPSPFRAQPEAVQ